MSNFLISSYAFGRISPMLLCLLIAVYMYRRFNTKSAVILSIYFLLSAIMHLAYFAGYSLMTKYGFLAWIVAALASTGSVVLLFFSYNFPRRRSGKEPLVVCLVALTLLCLAAFDYILHALREPVVECASYYGSAYISPYIPIMMFFVYLWTTIVFVRQSVDLSAEVSNNGFWQNLLLPATAEAASARTFALFVCAESVSIIIEGLIHTTVSFSSMKAMFISNALFLLIYAVYALVFLGGMKHQIPLMHRITGITLFVICVSINISAYIGFAQAEQEFSRKWTNFSAIIVDSILDDHSERVPEDVAAVVQISGGDERLLYTSYKLDQFSEIIMWNSLPAIRQILNRYGVIDNDQAVAATQYFTKMNGQNFRAFITGSGQKYAILIHQYTYREMIHATAIPFLIFLLVAGVVGPGVVFVVVKKGIITPLQKIMIRAGMKSTFGRDNQGDMGLVLAGLAVFTENTGQAMTSEHGQAISPKSQRKEDAQASPVNRNVEVKIIAAIDYIQRNYRYDISREGLASSVGLTPTYFGRMFLLYTGKKFHEYINDLRIVDAQTMLETTEKTITDIAFETGFESLSTFNRSFGRIAGMTPQEYRRSVALK